MFTHIAGSVRSLDPRDRKGVVGRPLPGTVL